VRLAYEMTIGVTAGVNFSYDEAFEARVLANIKVRFDGPSATSKRVEAQQHSVVSELISTPTNRSVWIHDAFDTDRGALAAICIYKKGKITSKIYVLLSKNNGRAGNCPMGLPGETVREFDAYVKEVKDLCARALKGSNGIEKQKSYWSEANGICGMH